MVFMGSEQSHELASVRVIDFKTGEVAFAYSVQKANSARGKQSAGEACAKHLKEAIEPQ
jgi:curli biogenesis system outer membrane secretion channel CsgG